MFNYIVTGYARHGKDTLCEYLESKRGISFSSSSWFACKEFIFDELKDKFGYDSAEQCFEDRTNHRSLWYEMIKAYNTPIPSKLGFAIFDKNNIYCGIRSKEELDGIKAKLNTVVIWVDASERYPAESEGSISVTKRDADIIIQNNGTLEQFYKAIDELFDELLITKPLAKAP